MLSSTDLVAASMVEEFALLDVLKLLPILEREALYESVLFPKSGMQRVHEALLPWPGRYVGYGMKQKPYWCPRGMPNCLISGVELLSARDSNMGATASPRGATPICWPMASWAVPVVGGVQHVEEHVVLVQPASFAYPSQLHTGLDLRQYW